MRASIFLLALSGYALAICPWPYDESTLCKREDYGEGLPPSQDPFYEVPSKLESFKPGTILRIRQSPGNVTKVVANCSVAYQILYRTTNSAYEPSFAVTTLLLPQKPLSISNNNLGNGSYSALLSYQIPYNSASIDGSPSYLLPTLFSVTTAGNPAATVDLGAALGLGWYINVPDFEGPSAAFGSGPQEGHAVLDSVRAALSTGLFRTYKEEEVRYAMWGYSGGSLASLWASELQEQYAPELKFVGAAVGGLVPNLTRIMENCTSSSFSGLIAPIALGFTAQFPEARKFLVDSLKTEGPYNATAFLAALHMNVIQSFVAFNNQDVFKYFKQGVDFFNTPIMAKLIGYRGTLGFHGIPEMPVFAYKAIGDQVSPVNDSDALISHYCTSGSNILYQRNTVGAHVAEITNGQPRALQFLSSVFDGSYVHKYSTSGCTIENVTIDIAHLST